jgi:hypothetical protein
MFSIINTAMNAVPIKMYVFITMLSSFHTADFSKLIGLFL